MTASNLRASATRRASASRSSPTGAPAPPAAWAMTCRIGSRRSAASALSKPAPPSWRGRRTADWSAQYSAISSAFGRYLRTDDQRLLVERGADEGQATNHAIRTVGERACELDAPEAFLCRHGQDREGGVALIEEPQRMVRRIGGQDGRAYPEMVAGECRRVAGIPRSAGKDCDRQGFPRPKLTGDDLVPDARRGRRRQGAIDRSEHGAQPPRLVRRMIPGSGRTRGLRPVQ